MVVANTAPEAEPAQPVASSIGNDVLGVDEPVHVADLVAVVRRDRRLDDRFPSRVELQDDLGVEVEAVGVLLERDVGKRVDAVAPVTAVSLRQLETRQRVLDAGEEGVVFFAQRHVGLQGVVGTRPARAGSAVFVLAEGARVDAAAVAFEDVLALLRVEPFDALDHGLHVVVVAAADRVA